MVFGKEEGKHKSRKTQTTTQIQSDDRAIDRNLGSSSLAVDRNGEITINGTISPSDASPLARTRSLSLSLIFRKCFEGKIEV